MIWVFLVICLLVSFLFSGIEAGVLSINPVRLSHNVRLDSAGALRLQSLLLQPQRLLLTVLLVTNFMRICAIILMSRICCEAFGNWGYLVTFLIAIPLFVVFLEMLPKSLFRRFPYRLLAPLSDILRVVYFVLSPAIVVFSKMARLFLKKEAAKDLFIAREELKELASEGEKSGSLEPVERAMIHNVVDFRSVLARDVMIPLARVTQVAPELPVVDLLALAKEKGWDRFPVADSTGRIIGLVRSFEVLLDGRLHTSVQHHLRRIITVHADEPAYRIIRKLRAARMSLAAVLDENDRPVGVVRPEDLIDRLITVNVSPTTPSAGTAAAT